MMHEFKRRARRQNKRFSAVILAVSAALFAGIAGQVHYASAANVTANATVNYATPIQRLDPSAIGMDISGYGAPNVFATDAVEQQKLKTLGVNYMRMDLMYSTSGDPNSKIVCGGDGCDTGPTGDQWINAIKSIGGTPVVIVHTGNNSAVDAANMVKHFNVGNKNPVKYWIIGNEPNMNGLTVQAYSNYFNQDNDVMKAVDPSIKVGGPTVAWYDGYWIKQFLQLSGSRVDFVDFHGYPQSGTSAGDTTSLFDKAKLYGTDLADLRNIINTTVPNRASQIFTEVGEWELDYGGNAQNDSNFHAVWSASTLGNILANGGRSLFYADKTNLLYGKAGTIIDSRGRTINVNLDDTNPAYQGIAMFTGAGLFPHFGNTMVQVTTTLPGVEIFASDNPKEIVVLNESATASQTANISLNGVTSGSVDVWRKDESILAPNPPAHIGTVAIQNGMLTSKLSPMSVTTFVVTPSGLAQGGSSTTSSTTSSSTSTSSTTKPTIPATTTSVPGASPPGNSSQSKCDPGAGQVTLYADSNFSGTCVRLDAGNYSTPAALAPLPGDSASSVKIGTNAFVTLYKDGGMSGAKAVITKNVADLSKTTVGNDSASSAVVSVRPLTPGVIVTAKPGTNGKTLQVQSSMTAQTGGNVVFVTQIYDPQWHMVHESSAAESVQIGKLVTVNGDWDVTGVPNGKYGILQGELSPDHKTWIVQLHAVGTIALPFMSN